MAKDDDKDEGRERNGGPDDPRLALILVDVESVTYLKVDKPRPLVLIANAMSPARPKASIWRENTVSKP